MRNGLQHQGKKDCTVPFWICSLNKNGPLGPFFIRPNIYKNKIKNHRCGVIPNYLIEHTIVFML